MAKYILTSKEVTVVKDKTTKKFNKYFVRLPKKDGSLKVVKANLSDKARLQLANSNMSTPCEITINDSFVKEESYTNKNNQKVTEKVVVILDLKVENAYEFDNVTVDDLACEVADED